MGAPGQVKEREEMQLTRKPWSELDVLSRRELEVLRLTAEGLSSKEVATRLGISPRTAEVHRAHIMRKLGCRNRVLLVRYALTRGIAAPEFAAR